MEVQGRAVSALTLLALAAALAAAGVVVASQPVRSPWWTYADADATYTATGLNLLLGKRAKYLDHPGLPLEELLEISFGADWLAHGAPARQRYVDARLLDLDRTRTVYRSWAAFFFLLGAAASTLIAWRLFGSWWISAAGGLLWLGAPGLAAMSIQYRPDVALTVLSLVDVYLVVRAARERSTALYVLAAAVLGFTTMVKMNAAVLAVPLALALLLRRPAEGWRPRLRLRPLLLIGLPWLALAVALNWSRFPFRPTAAQWVMLAAAIAVLVGAFALRRPLATVVGAVVAGALVPATLDVRDGLQSFVVTARGLTGGGVNTDVSWFSTPLHRFVEYPLQQGLVLFALAVVAAAIGVVGRDPEPALLVVAAFVLGLSAYARLGDVHYFAPGFVVAVPAVLWLLRRLDARLAVPVAVALVAYVVVPQLRHRDDARISTRAERAAAAPSIAAARRRVAAGEVALTPSYYPVAGTRWFELVQIYVVHAPRYPYRFLPDTERARRYAAERGLRVAATIR